MRALHKGDTIKCHDADDMIKTMRDLAKCGIETDFMYEKDGVKGLWLKITKCAVERAYTTNTKI